MFNKENNFIFQTKNNNQIEKKRTSISLKEKFF